jgi:hypothetical protein
MHGRDLTGADYVDHPILSGAAKVHDEAVALVATTEQPWGGIPDEYAHETSDRAAPFE